MQVRVFANSDGDVPMLLEDPATIKSFRLIANKRPMRVVTDVDKAEPALQASEPFVLRDLPEL